MKQISIQQNICPECRSDKIIFDASRGENVCTKCGLVIADYYMNQTDELFLYKIKKRRLRVGYSSDVTADLTTTFNPLEPKYSGEARCQLFRIRRMNEQRYIRHALINGIPHLRRYCIQMHLPNSIAKEAENNYKKIVSKSGIQGRGVKNFAAAVLYYTLRCRELAYTIRDVSKITGVQEKTIWRNLQRFMLNPPKHNIAKLISRFTRELGLEPEIEDTAQEVFIKIHRKTISMNPATAASVAIKLACKIKRRPLPIRHISKVTGVCEYIIRIRTKQFEPLTCSAN
ncbi:MAG: transcription initiation factor IIB family protein [Candidatus Bathyarchaeota archaeon]|nr:transcription initiation factor IIB family protein [Candidatus Bathyarchaeota archaeon]